MSQVTEIKMNPVAAAGMEGFSQFYDVCLGGQTADGRDATTDLSYAILKSVRPLQITSPDLCVRIHASTPEKFLHAVVETIKDGKGYPKP
jgi:pyruvate-formate lyase